jgi:hypothetical protein
LVSPGTAFCSSSIVGTPRNAAARTTGPELYPPTPITIAGRAATNDGSLRANYNFVSPRHFETLGIRIVRGRAFDEQEANANAPVVVISESTAQKFWPGQDAIGQHIGIGAALSPGTDNEGAGRNVSASVFPSYEVIGVAQDTRSGWVWEKDDTYLYVPRGPENYLGNYVMVRATGDVQLVMAAVHGEAEAIDPRLSAVVQRTTDHLDESMTPFRALALVSGVLGSLALLLASIGLYGVMSFVVTQRTREIGIRMALGASRGAAVWLILRDAAMMVAWGVAIALPTAWWLGRFVESQLFGVRATDWPTALGATALIATVALCASALPVRRATAISPISALRSE